MIGIDLGTTNSLVAVLQDGVPIVLENELGEGLTPSVVAVASDGSLLVGKPAKERLLADPTSGQAFFKRDMGTEARYKFGTRTWTPVECSATVLREMKRIAETHLGHEVVDAVITVPAYFHDAQRQATLAAAQAAGLNVKRLLNEPTAAALAYGMSAAEDLQTLLVFDLGGGTLDVTLLEIFDGVVEVKASAGESRLGGEDYTDLLVQHLMKKANLKLDERKMAQLRELVEKLKRKLSNDAQAELVFENTRLHVHQEELREVSKALTARFRPLIRRCVRDGGVTPQLLDQVLLVGGASRMACVKDTLRDELGVEASGDLDPDRVVALGAAVQAGLCARDAAVRELVLTDVCPHTLGIEISRWSAGSQHHEAGYFLPIIERNVTVPVSRSKEIQTLSPNQDEIVVKVYQGESRLVVENHKIGEFKVTGLRHQLDQSHPGEAEVRFTYDMNGILEVEVKVLSTKQVMAKVFEQRPGMLTAEEIEQVLARFVAIKKSPKDELVHRNRLERANRLYQDLSGMLRKTLSVLLDQYEGALESQEPEVITVAAAQLDQFTHPFYKEEDQDESA